MEPINAGMALERGLTTARAADRPIRVVQFGEGNFLRAFVDWIIQRLNDEGLFDGNVAIVQPLEHGRVKELEAQDRLYTVMLEGLKDGREVRSRELIDSIGATVDMYEDWEGYLALADNPDLKIVVSNTTEAGIALSDEDAPDAKPPKSYPAKLAQLLKRRYDQGLDGLLIIPCELIEDNGPALKRCLTDTARRFGWSEDFVDWLERENTFVSTLVDRIVPGYPRDNAEALWEELGYRDDNMVKAEPFALWVIAGDAEAQATVERLLPAKRLGIDLVTCDQVRPYRERKVFLLNGPHTTMAQVARLAGLGSVGEVMDDDELRSFIEREMREEIIPVLTLPEDELEGFADAVLERFRNPFVKHSLDSIALNSVAKFTARLLPIVHRNVEQGRGVPRRIALALAALIASYARLAPVEVAVADVDDVTTRLAGVTAERDSVVRALADTTLWGEDLTAIDGLADLVADDVETIAAGGIRTLVAPLA
ncbi:Mannitol dehydrogenase [Bifidobacterium lemurum]|uniref:Mannitol dehydrogenase n=1 Tax=Bifidobacterium lemurum TaxID=1603886 RepID=A0A261FW54_9BIFI|nr:tagaturonate reductase [Bifidobacterium lemurum]OZG63407.1 Mannitol dehydrogenase [Bifidobacterium lemurum]QOL34312.1 tagaturonate reductase [Bifidobacterium lemurum]